MARVVHFEIAVDDPERAVEFYTKTFGWKIQKWDGPQEYWLVMTGDEGQPGINGGIMRRGQMQQPVVNTVDVPSVDEAISTVVANGGKVVMGKTAVPGAGWLAYLQDTEGNVFGVMQMDTSAK